MTDRELRVLGHIDAMIGWDIPSSEIRPHQRDAWLLGSGEGICKRIVTLDRSDAYNAGIRAALIHGQTVEPVSATVPEDWVKGNAEASPAHLFNLSPSFRQVFGNGALARLESALKREGPHLFQLGWKYADSLLEEYFQSEKSELVLNPYTLAMRHTLAISMFASELRYHANYDLFRDADLLEQLVSALQHTKTVNLSDLRDIFRSIRESDALKSLALYAPIREAIDRAKEHEKLVTEAVSQFANQKIDEDQP